MLFRNYVKIALRHLSRHRLFTFIHIICLATGITFALVIGVYVYHERRVNAGLQDVNNQYIIKSQWKIKGMGLDFTTLPPLAKTMREEYPNLVRNYYRYNPVSNVVTVCPAPAVQPRTTIRAGPASGSRARAWSR